MPGVAYERGLRQLGVAVSRTAAAILPGKRRCEERGATAESVAEYNARLYDQLWSYAEFHSPESLPWWPVFGELSEKAPRRLEVGPGLFPRLAVRGTHVVELTERTLAILADHGAIPHLGDLRENRFPAAWFDLAGVFEVLEHVEDDEGLVRELARVIRPGGHLALSVPLGMRYFGSWDRFSGHVRRYEPEELRGKLERAGFELEQFSTYDHGADTLGVRLLPLLFKASPRLGVWLFMKFAIPEVCRFQIEWVDARHWEERTVHASECTLVCRRHED